MSRRPFVLGLTGSIGMGKSTVAAMFRKMGVPVFDADAAVHRLQGPGGGLVAAIEALFPGSARGGQVDRVALAAAVSGAPAALRRLERLVHPAVAEERTAFLRRARARRLVVIDLPLLFETRAEQWLDAVLVVSAPASLQRRRVLARPGMSTSRLRHILTRQMPDREKRRRADFVISTATGVEATRRQVRRLAACLAARPARYCRRCARSSSIPRPRA